MLLRVVAPKENGKILFSDQDLICSMGSVSQRPFLAPIHGPNLRVYE